MKKGIVLLFALLLSSATLFAQDYNWAVGVRGGITTSGLTVKHNFDPANTVEGVIDFARGFNVIALYERNVPVITDGFRLYYGAGMNLGSWDKHAHSKFTMGFDAIVGLEYKLYSIPLAFSVDYKPCLNFVGNTGFHAADFGLGVKFTF